MTIKYIIGHWTAGGYAPTSYEKQHYQALINDAGKMFVGSTIGTTSSTGGMNSITYNVACCGGLNSTPITAKQMEAFCKFIAEKLRDYNLPVEKFFTHAEIGEMTRNYQTKQKGGSLNNADCGGKLITDLLYWNKYLPQNIGKVDLRTLPNTEKRLSNYTAKQSGDYLRGKIRWYMSKV